jgi:hypothetical protein
MSKPLGALAATDRRGQTASWTADEDERLRSLYPRYDLLQSALPHRSLAALKHRARRLDIVHRRHIWTNLEVRRLREAFENHAPDKELEALFPGIRLSQIKAKAGHIKAPHRRAQRAIFKVQALDAIRHRAKARGLSYVELDRQAKTGKFYQKCRRQPMLRPIARAAALLQGDVHIEWHDLD